MKHVYTDSCVKQMVTSVLHLYHDQKVVGLNVWYCDNISGFTWFLKAVKALIIMHRLVS